MDSDKRWLVQSSETVRMDFKKIVNDGSKLFRF